MDQCSPASPHLKVPEIYWLAIAAANKKSPTLQVRLRLFKLSHLSAKEHQAACSAAPRGRSPDFWLLSYFAGLPSPLEASGSLDRVRQSSYQLQWRDRAGLSPASLFNPLEADHLEMLLNC